MGWRRTYLKGIKPVTRVVCFGVEKSVEEWANITNLPEAIILNRLRHGDVPFHAFTTDATFMENGKERFFPTSLPYDYERQKELYSTIEKRLGLTAFDVSQVSNEDCFGYIVDRGSSNVFHMTDDEIRRSYARAADPVAQIEIIAELNAVTWVMARDKLVELGLVSSSVEPPATRKPGRPKKSRSEL